MRTSVSESLRDSISLSNDSIIICGKSKKPVDIEMCIYIYINIYSVLITYINVFEKCLFYPFLTSSLPSASLNEASKIHQPTPGHLLGLKHPHCPHWKSWVGPATKHPPTEKSQENSWELQRSPKHAATNMMLFLTPGWC